ncbi:LysR family transcriptional regulator [Elizabethkingia anophelis]|uniref:LysR family transcriptional regulator n=1 Tax=Elizabethkingia anophelis TaxID=1117645 RepID=UPI0020B3B5CA|nr:LysR family transcriptional regulator [Elizabethkingia anophelis]MCT4306148.1 LysR family transcriptional regulator [Elizabethkingia anophelis]MDV3831811.1 hypothetical protein [Elizabethkingia anophelis]UTF95115.1 LysR family transcriptional regulator [Elizabethkingia anophelis]
MNINHLKYFKVVSEELSFTNAAKKLHITQPPLSRAIRELEDDLNCILFFRNKRNVVLTNEGMFLLDKANKIFSLIQRSEKEIHDMSIGKSGYLNIGFVGSVYDLINPFIKNFNKTFPEISLNLMAYSTAEQIKMLENNELDITFVRGPLNTISNFESKKINEENFVLISSIETKIQINKINDFHKLKNENFIMFPREYGSVIYDQIIALCNMANLFPNIKHESLQLDTIIRMVENGLGIAIVPESAIFESNAKLNKSSLYFMPQRTSVYIYYKKSANKILNNFISLF